MSTSIMDILHPLVDEYHQGTCLQSFATAQNYEEPLSCVVTLASQQEHR